MIKEINKMPKTNKRIVIGMSGGVDSSVAAWMLKKAGYNVVGVFMKYWRASGRGNENACCSTESMMIARRVAHRIGIPFFVMDARAEFKKNVVRDFIGAYEKGQTPNPCVVCNKEIKFKLLLKYAKKMGAAYVATGHYARIGREIPSPKHQNPNRTEAICLYRGVDQNKDQSYFLWKLSQKELSKIIFPLGRMKKEAVIKIAKKNGLPIPEAESQEICFISGELNQFLSQYLPKKYLKRGEMIDIESNKIIDEHAGLPFYTIGQRAGISYVGSIKDENSATARYYIVGKDIKRNLLFVGPEIYLESKGLIADHLNLINPDEDLNKIKNLSAQVRYRQKAIGCKAVSTSSSRTIEIIFDKPIKAITPGQSLVLFAGERVVGGGIIKKAFNARNHVV